MKYLLTILAIAAILLLSACAPSRAQSSTVDARSASTEVQTAEISTAISSSTSVPLSTITIPTATEMTIAGSNDAASSNSDVTQADNSKTINMKVGDSFLLNLGSDFYDWTVEVDNQKVISREINITVINGAQGIYLAHAPGSAKLTAYGNPQCLNSTPPCLALQFCLRLK